MRQHVLMSWATIAAAVLVAVVLSVVLLIICSLFANRAPLFDPPGPGARLRLYLGSNVAHTSPVPVLPELGPIVLLGNVATALQSIVQAAQELGWQQLTVDEPNAQVRAVIVSRLFRFSDDIHVRLLRRAEDRTEAVVRSASRVGRGDLGANAHHIMALREALRRRALLAGDRT